MVVPYVKTVRKEFSGSFERIYAKVQDEIRQQVVHESAPISLEQIRVSPVDLAPVIPPASTSSVQELGRRLGYAEAQALLSSRGLRDTPSQEQPTKKQPVKSKRKVWLPSQINRDSPRQAFAPEEPRESPVRIEEPPGNKIESSLAFRSPSLSFSVPELHVAAPVNVPSKTSELRRKTTPPAPPETRATAFANVTYPPDQKVTRRFIDKPEAVLVTLDSPDPDTAELEKLVKDTHKLLVSEGIINLDNFGDIEQDLLDLESELAPDWSEIEADIEALQRDLAKP